jgi:hypothetical protein
MATQPSAASKFSRNDARWFSAKTFAFLIFLPNLVWLAHHDFISYRFLQHIHVGEGRAEAALASRLSEHGAFRNLLESCGLNGCQNPFEQELRSAAEERDGRGEDEHQHLGEQG